MEWPRKNNREKKDDKEKKIDNPRLVYKFTKKCGAGGQGYCDFAECVKTGRKLVIKKTDIYQRYRGDKPMEVHVLKDILKPHPHILELLDYDYGPKHYRSIYPRYGGGDLEPWIPQPGHPTASEAFMWHIFSGVAEGLAYLHYGYDKRSTSVHPHSGWKRVVHQDIKVDNIFLRDANRRDKNGRYVFGQIVLGDFGLSTTEWNTKECALAQCAAPEVGCPEENRMCTAKNDVWCLGTIIHRLATGCYPLKPKPRGYKDMRAWGMVPDSRDPQRLDRKFYSSELNSVMHECFEWDLHKRINSQDLYHLIQHRARRLSQNIRRTSALSTAEWQKRATLLPPSMAAKPPPPSQKPPPPSAMPTKPSNSWRIIHVKSRQVAFFTQTFPQREPLTPTPTLQLAAEAQAILSDPTSLKKLVRKIDLTIAPLLAAVYFLQFLDKTTLSYTAVMGIRKDTHLVGQEYSDLSMLFYIGFLAAEFPTQYLAQRISHLGRYLGVNIVIWGFILGCHAACTSFAGLSICRTLLGVFESCVAPILVLIIAMWYKKNEQGRRVSWFYVCNSLTMIFGGAVAYGVSFTHNKFASWRIFYIAIGALTMCVGVLVAVLLPDSPVKARRFSDAEKVAALLRVKGNQSGTQNARVKKDQVMESFKDVRVWLVMLATMLSSIPNGGISNFNNILLTTFGYSSQQALILNTPSGAVGAVCVLLVGWLSDRWGDRSVVMMVAILPTILGAALMIGLDPGGVPKNKAGLLAASFLTGTFGAAFMLLLAWNASNIAGHSKKVTANALTLVAFCVGNILGTQTFQDKEAPGYKSGKVSIVATLSVLCVVVVVMRLYNDHLNRKNHKILGDMNETEREALREKMAFADQTDRHNPFFVYTH
ncbi:uncharacterized protein KY384_001281 [Bacidia gigantensis]|uniref:uncharacterized protein n=1 Tax=Bacidia gigantensis TaxID=2732470 RepID=UPI001D05A107|nr:uncharacterized protein KY384_001281 [Bacidia gigantensis]KAG8533541.1 hypothetical protein KY384_001281 [Bacidia gigantensis]